MAEDNGKPNPDECYSNKYQKHVSWSYGYNLVAMKKWEKCNKGLVMTKEHDQDLKTLINVGSVIILKPIVILK